MKTRFLILLFSIASFSVGREASATVRPWEPVDIELEAADAHPWWTLPVRATFQTDSGAPVILQGFANGGNRWVIRFAAPRPGVWTYRTSSADRALHGRTGRIVVAAAAGAERERNPNLRGSIRIAPGGRHFEYADGTPFFFLADTLWAGNTARCGLGEREDGPFFQYLSNRKAKGFTAILMQYFHGYGDYPDSPGHRNEGGHAFFERNPARLNPAHFAALDQRMRALWERGFVTAIPTTWWGKTRNCVFTPADAGRISAYCAVRYGAFNAVWSLSGEYQYAFSDCGWTPADFAAIGATVQEHNPYHRPLSIHPSSRTNFPAPHNVQSSRPFHGEPWLDHHWLQTGQSFDRLHNIVSRIAEVRALRPAAPVFCSEAFYETPKDPDSAYHARWQVWTALLNGAAGYGYGAGGIWQFFDPGDSQGETGKNVNDVVPWREAIGLPGSSQLWPAKKLLTRLDWWKLEPERERLLVNGEPNPRPTATDISPPHAAVVPSRAVLVYLPRGNAGRPIALAPPPGHDWTARWFDPRRGEFEGGAFAVPRTESWTIPRAPAPREEDWVLFLEPINQQGAA
jgi:hypothetical protein